MQEKTDRERQLKTRKQKSTHKCGNDIRRKQKKRREDRSIPNDVTGTKKNCKTAEEETRHVSANCLKDYIKLW